MGCHAPRRGTRRAHTSRRLCPRSHSPNCHPFEQTKHQGKHLALCRGARRAHASRCLCLRPHSPNRCTFEQTKCQGEHLAPAIKSRTHAKVKMRVAPGSELLKNVVELGSLAFLEAPFMEHPVDQDEGPRELLLGSMLATSRGGLSGRCPGRVRPMGLLQILAPGAGPMHKTRGNA
jgi:hypothetical protein